MVNPQSFLKFRLGMFVYQNRLVKCCWYCLFFDMYTLSYFLLNFLFRHNFETLCHYLLKLILLVLSLMSFPI
ncbi:hypothetical protein HanIR_Chr04g0163301 [Helianthus annuus]|nr:hypothetical protein HanIR_Chr04g0163301 [Helianthus annuus]